MATQLAERRDDPVAVVRQTLSTMGDQLKMALPSHVPVDKFHRCTMTAIQANPALIDADRRSLFGAIVKAAQDGLLPDGREGALVMFGKQVQWMPMVAGILKKVRQSGELASIAAHVVHEGDDFVYRLGDNESIDHRPPALDQDRGKAIGAYAVATLKDGSKVREVMSLAEIEKVRKVSRASGNGPWVAWWGEMARKTVIRRLSKRLPMSTDIEAAFSRDDTMQAETAAHVLTAIPNEQPAPAMSRLDALEYQIGTDAGEQASDDAAQDRPSTALPPAAPAGDPITEAGQDEAASTDTKQRTPLQLADDYVTKIGKMTSAIEIGEFETAAATWLDKLAGAHPDLRDHIRIETAKRLAALSVDAGDFADEVGA